MTEDATTPTKDNERVVVWVCYGLYGLGLFGMLIPSIAALIVNYIKVDQSRAPYAEHHRWLIRTFWWGLLWGVIGALLMFVGVGAVILFAVAIWWLYRLIKGALALSENRAPVAIPIGG